MSLLNLPLQTLVNRALEYDPVARRKLAGLTGKSLVLDMTEPSLTLVLEIDAAKGREDARVIVGFTRPADYSARVSGRAADLVAVLQASDRTQAMMAHQIDIHGDTRTFFTIQEILSGLDIDWEMALGDQFGDLPAHLLADGLRFLGGMAKAHGRSLDRTARNFLREESGWLVPTSLWREHARKVHDVRLDTDRLGARIERLGRQLNATNERNRDAGR